MKTRDELRTAVGEAMVDMPWSDVTPEDVEAEDFEGRLLTDKTAANSFKLDSLDCVELVVGVEDALDIQITDEEAEQCKTVGDLLDLCERLVNAG